MATENVFTAASKKANESMAKATKGSAKKSSTGKEKVVNVRVPEELHRRMMQHRLDTGETMQNMILRLIKSELKDEG